MNGHQTRFYKAARMPFKSAACGRASNMFQRNLTEDLYQNIICYRWDRWSTGWLAGWLVGSFGALPDSTHLSFEWINFVVFHSRLARWRARFGTARLSTSNFEYNFRARGKAHRMQLLSEA